MKDEQDYIRDITEMRSMMERSSKFLSLSGWAGIMAGSLALAGAYIAWRFLNFNPSGISDALDTEGNSNDQLNKLFMLALAVLILASFSAIFFSQQRARRRGEGIWNSTTRRLLISMLVPLAAGGILILILVSKGLIGLMAPLSLLFYGLALFNASKFTVAEVRTLGFTEILLGLIACFFIEYSLLIWALGFGIVHIIYGIYMHYRYER